MASHLTFPELIGTPHSFLSREGGVSTGIYEGLNCGPGSDDDPDNVRENRRIAASLIAGRRDTPLVSLYQIHSNEVVTVRSDWGGDRPKADAMVTTQPGIILGILTADCTPVLFADMAAGVVGAAHAGWQGALSGVIENTVATMEECGAKRDNIAAAIGPTIQQTSYEVSVDFEARFLAKNPDFGQFFTAGKDASHRQFNLPALVENRLEAAGVRNFVNCGMDTYASDDHYSYRRTTHRSEADYGRQLSGIMLTR